MTPIPIIVPTHTSGTSQPLPEWLNYTCFGIFSLIFLGLLIAVISMIIWFFKEDEKLIGFITMLLLPLPIILELIMINMIFLS